MAKIFHAHLRGDRETKYDRLMQSDINKTVWSELLPQTPFHLLIPQDTTFLAEYEQGLRITDIMPVNSTGVKTHRDHFAIDFKSEDLYRRIEEFRDLSFSDEEIAHKFDLCDTRDWKLNHRRQSLAKNLDWEKHLTNCLYRPFDVRAYFHNQDIVELPRNDVMQHMVAGENLGLISNRQIRLDEVRHFFVSDCIVENKILETANGAGYLFPLYLHSNALSEDLGITRRPNFSQPFLNDITAKLGYTPTPEAIFYYIYAIFHSPSYRSRYAEFLKIDFPRVPLTRNDTLFRQLAAYGEQLVALHLMKSAKLEQTHQHPQFVEQGGNCIVDPAHPKYEINTRSVIINKKGDRFTDIPQAVWNFYVGGYPVCAKWLKDRKGRTLSPQDITHYHQIVIALSETIKLMAAIDQAIPGFPIE